MRNIGLTVLTLTLFACCICKRVYCQSAPPSKPAGMLHLTDSSNKDAIWKGFNANGQPVFEYSGEEHVIAPERLIAWQPEDESSSPRGEAVALVDGSVVTGLIAALRDDSIRIQTSQFGLVTFTKAQVAAILLDASSHNFNELYRQWSRDSTQGDDTIYLRDGQITSGVIKTVGSSTLLRLSNTQSVEIESGTSITQISVSRVAAIRFSPILFPIDVDSSGIIYDFADGTHLVVKSGRLRDKNFEIATVAGVTLTVGDTQACVDQCVGIFSDASASSGWKFVAESDVLETRGQSPWTRKVWVYFESEVEHHRTYAPDQIQLHVVPSVRIKLSNQKSWKKLVGALQVIPIADEGTVTSDVLGNRVQANADRILDASSLNVRFVAVVGGKLVDLWTNSGSSSGEQIPFSLDISKYSDFYLLVENSNIFSTPTEIIFDRIRYSQ